MIFGKVPNGMGGHFQSKKIYIFLNFGSVEKNLQCNLQSEVVGGCELFWGETLIWYTEASFPQIKSYIL